VVFPFTKLNITVEIQLNGTWTDISQYCMVRDDQGGILIERGRQDEASEVDAGRCTLELDNTDLRFSPRYPNGAYYGMIGRNTPLRVSVNAGSPYLYIPGVAGSNNASTPDAAALDITGDIDVRFEGSLSNYLDASDVFHTTQIMAKLGTTAGTKSWFFGVRDNLLYFEWSADGTNTLSASSTVQPVPDPDDKLAIRATMDVNDGSGNRVIKFYTAETMDGPWIQLGDTVTTSGTTSIFNSASALQIGEATGFAFTNPDGRVLKAEVRNGINGTVVANPDFTAQTLGATSFADSAGRTWTINGDTEITDKRIRFVGEVPDWPLQSDTSGNDVSVKIQAAGILRRLGQGEAPIQSTLRRRLPSYNPLAYWPMEDGSEATQASSPIDGVGPLKLSPANWAGEDTLASSNAVVTINSGTTTACEMKGIIPAPSGTLTEWSATQMYRVDSAPATERTFLRVTATGTVAEWRLQSGSGGSTVFGYDSDGGTVFSQALATGTDIFGQWIFLQLDVTQSGGNVAWAIRWKNLAGDAGEFSSSFAGTIGRPTAFVSPANGFAADLDGMALGHLAAWPEAATPAYDNAIVAWSGEAAGERITRLATEDNVPVRSNNIDSDSVLVGTQGQQTILNLLREAQDADFGILYEERESIGLYYRNRESLYNQTPALILDYPTRGDIMPPLTPVDDDQNVANKVTAERANGSSATAELTSGAMSTQAPPNGVGLYEDKRTFTLHTDDQTDDAAGWMLHLGTVDEPRYPLLTTWLQSTLADGPNNARVDQVMSIDSGDRIQITNPASKINNDTVDLMVQGYTEFISQFRWEFDFVCTPASPWDVAWVAPNGTTDNVRRDWSHVGASSSAVTAAAVDSDDTEISVRNLETEYWTHELSDMPFDWTIGGEVVTVTSPGDLETSNPFFITDLTNWTTADCSITRETTIIPTHPRAVASMKVTPAGGVASGGASSAMTATGSINIGGLYQCGMWVYSPAGWSDIRVVIDWYTSADAFISTSLGSANVIPAGVWTWISQTDLAAPATASKMKVRARYGGTPASTDVFYVWGPRACRRFSWYAYDQFGRTDTDTWTNTDSGLTWTNTGGTSADYDVLSGYGRHVCATVNSSRRSTVTALHANSDQTVDIAVSATATGGSMYAHVSARALDVNNMYLLRLEHTTGGSINMQIRKRVGGTETQVGSTTFSPEQGYTAGTFIRVRFRVVGTSLKAKIWRTTDPEPDGWRIDETDSSLTAADPIGFRSIVSASNTNVNPEIRYDNYYTRSPQTYTVIRSVNGVVKSQVVSAPIKLTPPAIVAL
jgi:hypothetical protein